MQAAMKEVGGPSTTARSRWKTAALSTQHPQNALGSREGVPVTYSRLAAAVLCGYGGTASYRNMWDDVNPIPCRRYRYTQHTCRAPSTAYGVPPTGIGVLSPPRRRPEMSCCVEVGFAGDVT